MNTLQLFEESIAAMVPSILITLSGIFICYKKWFDANINIQMLQATTDFMLPLYVLFSLPYAYKTNELWKLWPLIVSPIIVVPILAIVGFLCALLVDAPRHLRYSVSSVYCFASIGNIGILILKSSCSHYGLLRNEDNCSFAIPYRCMMWLPFNIIMFFIAIPFLSKEGGYNGEKTSNLLLKYLMLPLPVAAVVANVLGAIPGMTDFLFNKDSIGYMLTDCALIIGYTGILFSQMNVGSNMILDSNEKMIMSKWKILWIAISRNIFVPAVVAFYVNLMWDGGLLYDDKVMAYVIFIGLSAPSTFMILIFMKQFGINDKEIKVIILWIFITAGFTMIFSIFLFFIIL